MRRLERIAIGIDFSSGATRAVERIVHVPLAKCVEIVLVHVMHDDRMSSRNRDEAARQMGRHLAKLRASLAPLAYHDVRVRGCLLEGTPAAAIDNLARDAGCDLVIVGRRGARGRRKTAIGSTAEWLINCAAASVLVVGPPPARPYGAPVIGVTDAANVRCAIDGALCMVYGSLRRLDVVAPTFVPIETLLWAGWTSSIELLRIRSQLRERARESLRLALRPYRDRDIPLRAWLRDGDPRDVILAEAENRRSDLVIVSDDRESIAPHVVRHASSDVLVARSMARDRPRAVRSAPGGFAAVAPCGWGGPIG